MKKTAAADVVIFGGGIAGLWLLNRLRQDGLSVLLFESGALGGGQTHKAQGIIHGGMKYALQGNLTQEAQAIADMPALWKKCLAGEGEMDLSEVPILSQIQYLWSPNKFTAKLTGFLANAALNSEVKALNRNDYPEILKNPSFKGEVYALDEIVIDVPILIRELVKANQDGLFAIEPISEEGFKFDEQGNLISATVYMAGKSVEVQAQQFIFTAGSGNEHIIKNLPDNKIAMQRRPLHMVMVKLPFDCPLYAHCLGIGSRPRLTITSHSTNDHHTIWYLGGALAENGIGLESSKQIKEARKELKSLFPWLDFNRAEFATFMIDRAEAYQKTGLKPEKSYSQAVHNVVVAWPTKMVLAPQLAQEISWHIQKQQVEPRLLDIRELRAWPMPPVAKPIWEDFFCKKDISA